MTIRAAMQNLRMVRGICHGVSTCGALCGSWRDNRTFHSSKTAFLWGVCKGFLLRSRDQGDFSNKKLVALRSASHFNTLLNAFSYLKKRRFEYDYKKHLLQKTDEILAPKSMHKKIAYTTIFKKMFNITLLSLLVYNFGKLAKIEQSKKMLFPKNPTNFFNLISFIGLLSDIFCNCEIIFDELNNLKTACE